ncbi:acyl-CoA dehydrogenase domain protein [Segniliparus rotundus DSM 44985]|uniref:Acyl-CoA dehydrogenase domain protein n=1 Tax=Segniliparus rotundus (strain ATCC BAA-972 / CDC 1076 / CIP 108378 / DSM 44985 / JCM 13578) TaxID=640132 RepID=D6ZEP9_SEGRD|nr:acyl-CoA dehydrogenase family protein [Segniliparus rotundus]ADG97423.1 acyl-CoA dehydrogenase domain protein [Segniliparus rotundus DSM 44985]
MKRTLFEEEHDLFRGAFRSFLEQHAVPRREEWLKSGVVDRGLWLEAGKNGFLGMSVPARYGGGDGAEDFRFNSVIVEEIARSGCSGIGFSLHNDIVQPYLMSLATEEQKQRWLPGFCSGEMITAIAMTEPGTGSDLQGIQTNAVRKGDDWLLNGAKTFITNGVNADLVIVVAQTEPGSGAKGLTLFAVERGMAGFERGRKLDKIGLRAQDTAELVFQDVVVPQENVLGEVGQAFAYLMQNLAQERLSIAVAAAITIELSIEMTVEYVKNRKAFGKPIGKFQNTRFVLAELSAEAAAVRALVDRSIEFHLRGELSIPDAAIAKLYSTERQVHVVDRCLQLHGGYGYMLEYPIAQAYVDSRIQTIYGGTSEVMKEIIGRSMAL